LHLSSETPVSNFLPFKCNLYRYNKEFSIKQCKECVFSNGGAIQVVNPVVDP
jgi:hypothetical protein